MHAGFFEGQRDLQLVFGVERGARHLLAVAERRVAEEDRAIRENTDDAAVFRAPARRSRPVLPWSAAARRKVGMSAARDAHWLEAEKSFRRAIELDPNRSDTFAHYAVFLLWPLERTDEAIQELRLAQKTDPLSNEVRQYLCYALPSTGRFEEAAANCEMLPEDFPFRSWYFGRARVLQSRIADGIQILETEFRRGVTPGSEVRAFLGYAYARTGRREEAEKMAIGTNPFNQAVIFAGLGDKERALEAMERSDAAGPFRVGRQLTFPELAPIRNDPRMKALRKRVGLPN